MQLAFILTMPGAPTWNGKWSGDDRLHCIIKTFRSESEKKKAVDILTGSPYSYRWDDGWCARIQVIRVVQDEVRDLRRRSCGFAGYDWMVDTIISHGKPLASHELPEKIKSCKTD